MQIFCVFYFINLVYFDFFLYFCGAFHAPLYIRAGIEHRLGHSVIGSDKAIDHIKPQDELPFEKEDK